MHAALANVPALPQNSRPASRRDDGDTLPAMNDPLSPLSRRAARIAGARDALAPLTGLMPFGLITGAAATAAGMDAWLAMAMSLILFAGAAQLAAIQLMTQHAPLAIVIATIAIVNLRFMMYSAAVAPHLRRFTRGEKALAAYLLTDHMFALITARFRARDDTPHLNAYYFTAAGLMWLSWHAMVAIGVFAGTLIPKAWALDFAIPLVFLALVLPTLSSRAHWCAALAAGGASLFTASLPLKLGLIAAAAAGILVGWWLDRSGADQTGESA